MVMEYKQLTLYQASSVY